MFANARPKLLVTLVPPWLPLTAFFSVVIETFSLIVSSGMGCPMAKIVAGLTIAVTQKARTFPIQERCSEPNLATYRRRGLRDLFMVQRHAAGLFAGS